MEIGREGGAEGNRSNQRRAKEERAERSEGSSGVKRQQPVSLRSRGFLRIGTWPWLKAGLVLPLQE